MRCNSLLVLTLLPLLTMAGEPGSYQVERGVQIPLSLVNDISTASAIVGDPIYLRTSFPVASGGRILIWPGSWVKGTITGVSRARRGQHRGELHVRFDSLLLSNGVSRKLGGHLGVVTSATGSTAKRGENEVIGAELDKGAAARKVVLASVAGASVGSIAQIGSLSFGNSRSFGPGGGVGSGGLIGGAAIGAAAGAVLVFTGRGAEARIAPGSVVVMILEEPLTFSASELD